MGRAALVIRAGPIGLPVDAKTWTVVFSPGTRVWAIPARIILTFVLEPYLSPLRRKPVRTRNSEIQRQTLYRQVKDQWRTFTGFSL